MLYHSSEQAKKEWDKENTLEINRMIWGKATTLLDLIKDPTKTLLIKPTKMNEFMNFEAILPRLKNGEPVRRFNWEEGTFIFQQVPSRISKEIVPKMQSLPEKVKEIFVKRFEDSDEQIDDAIYYNNQVAHVTKSNLITSYTPSISDLTADDWELIQQ